MSSKSYLVAGAAILAFPGTALAGDHHGHGGGSHECQTSCEVTIPTPPPVVVLPPPVINIVIVNNNTNTNTNTATASATAKANASVTTVHKTVRPKHRVVRCSCKRKGAIKIRKHPAKCVRAVGKKH
jgi:hypothetical protein